MATLQDQLKKSKNLTNNRLKSDLFQYIRSLEKDFLDKNKEQLKRDSSDIFGKPIGFYSKATDILTNGKKAWGTPFTSFDTGDFFKGFVMQEIDYNLSFRSTDSKTQLILKSKKWLSHELFGLTDKNLKAIISKRLLPFYIKNIRNILEI